MVRVSGISPPVHIFGFDRDINTLEKAVKERVFFVKLNGIFTPPPKPTEASFAPLLRHARDELSKYLPKTAPMTRRQFVDTFRGRKKAIYERAHDNLLQGRVGKELAKVKIFVKYEKTLGVGKPKVPRVVSPRTTEYNIEVGRYLRRIEKNLYKCIGKMYGHPTVIKGYNAVDSAKIMYHKWNMFKNPVAVGLDASRFDQHVSKQALQFEHDIYLSCFPRKRHRQQLKKLLSWQLNNKCVGYCPDGKLKYSVDGTRMSGDMNTGLGNCVLMCSMIWAYAHELNVNVQLANNGDDCVVIMEAEDLGKFMKRVDSYFLKLGFTMAVEQPVYKLEEIEFCQTHPVYIGPNHDDYIMVRVPKTALAKDTACLKNWTTEKMHRGWLQAVGAGGLSMTGGIPIFQDFYMKYLEHGKHWKKVGEVQSWGVRKMAEGLTRQYATPSDETRASFYFAFGITPDEQICIEKFYREVSMSYHVVNQVEYQTPLPL